MLLNRKSVVYKLVTTLIAVVTLVMIGISLVYFLIDRFNSAENIRTDADQTVKRLSNSLVYPLWNVNNQEIEKSILFELSNRNIEAIVINDYNNKFLIGKIQNTEGKVAGLEPDYLSKKQLKIYYQSKENIIKDQEIIGSVTVYYTDKLMNQSAAASFIKVLMYTAGISITLFLMLYTSIRINILLPLLNLEEEVAKIKDNDLTVRIPVKSADEIGRLAETFNQLVTKLQNYNGELEKLVAERTKDLENANKIMAEKVAELEQMNKLMVGREIKMTELKNEIEKLKISG
jgi:nitrate/nitrite-specific signal transduction histidine kinase